MFINKVDVGYQAYVCVPNFFALIMEPLLTFKCVGGYYALVRQHGQQCDKTSLSCTQRRTPEDHVLCSQLALLAVHFYGHNWTFVRNETLSPRENIYRNIEFVIFSNPKKSPRS